jgi:hypothetical protein
MLEFIFIRGDTEIFMLAFSQKCSYFRGNFFMKIDENNGHINDMAYRYLEKGAYDWIMCYCNYIRHFFNFNFKRIGHTMCS